MDINPELNDFILSLPKEHKLRMLKEAQSLEKLGEFLNLMKVYLDAPIEKGGISTEDIEHYLDN